MKLRSWEIGPAALPLLLGLALAAARIAPSHAADSESFVIAAAEGYGVEDCLGEGGECGKIVADAWCEAHGRGTAIKFGRAEDITGAISTTFVAATSNPIVITCAK
jgi:hypothetical protein